MKKNIKKIFIIILSIIFIMSLLTWMFLTIKKNDEMLLKVGELREIQSEMMSYHLYYGIYPISKSDILINDHILCKEGFIEKNKKCTNVIWDPKDLMIDFTYKKNESGLNYSIEFNTNEDNKYLNCIHKISENKKGCKFIYDLKNGLIVTE